MTRFPGPYLNDCKAEDPIMERVPMDSMGIGANNAGLPNKIQTGEMSIKHVGGSLGKGE
jgi:hypothetical protein